MLQTELPLFYFFFFNDTATTEIYTLSLHDALPISMVKAFAAISQGDQRGLKLWLLITILAGADRDRKSTRLNSSHLVNSYAVFCLKKKKDYLQRLAVLLPQPVEEHQLQSDLEHRYN